MDENIAIKVEGLTKIYPIYNNKNDRMKEALSIIRKKYHTDFHALNNLNFEVKKGETVGIIGQNGAGKSTLLKILTGVLSPTLGSVTVNGKVSALLELGAGFNPEMTGMENIYLNGTIMGYTKEEMGDRIPKIIEFADIGEFINQPVKMYSSGMFARLAFAVAINVDPEILIVDEALSVGDIRFQIKCMNKMKQMMEGGTTVLLVTHDINAIRRFCARAMWIYQGEIKEIGNVNKVADQYLDYLKLGEMQEFMHFSCENIIVNESNKLKPFTPGSNIAEIVDFILLNRKGEMVSEIEYDEYMCVEVTYDVYDENIANPVLGVAAFGLDEDYLCGLNTLLDKIEIPWIYGRNKFSLEYQGGVRALGGKYYFDVALFEETATVAIHYIKKVKEFSIISNYKAEGRYVIPHNWRREYE